MFKRVFSKKNPPVSSTSKSIRIPDLMLDELEKLAISQGESLNSFIVLILDQFLQIQLEEKAKAEVTEGAPS